MNATPPPEDQLEFNETFDTPILDPSRWLPYYLPHWSGRARSAAQYTLPGKGLALHITADQQPWLPEIDGALRVSCLQTGGRSGALGSRDGQHRFHPDLRVREVVEATRLYTPRFGYFETRVRALPIPGYMLALWMIGFEEHPHESGEICIFELFGQDLTPGAATVRYGVHPFGDPTLREEFYADTLPVDASEFHTYALDWQPDRLHFFVDGTLLRTVWQSPQYPMQFMLTLYELPAQLQPSDAPWPRTAYVDYLRGYRRTAAH